MLWLLLPAECENLSILGGLRLNLVCHLFNFSFVSTYRATKPRRLDSQWRLDVAGCCASSRWRRRAGFLGRHRPGAADRARGSAGRSPAGRPAAATASEFSCRYLIPGMSYDCCPHG